MPVSPEEWIPQRMLAEFFHVDRGTVRKWQTEMGFPKPFYVGSIGFYVAVDLITWQQTTKAAAPREPPKRPVGEKLGSETRRNTAKRQSDVE